jgi:dTDP-4-dehydrorhamnose reductase
MTSVLVLGGSGMVGAMVVDVLDREPELEVTATVRSAELVAWGSARLPSVRWRVLDAARGDIGDAVEGHRWVINAIGITKPYIQDDNRADIERGIAVNAVFPHRLADAAERAGARVVHIATDCAYSGGRGGYTETDLHDASDVYGKTKSLGEVYGSTFHNVRCSVVGPEPNRRSFLLEWFRHQPEGARLTGFTNQTWNGVTTLQFARICAGVVKATPPLLHLQHVIPADTVTKAELLEIFAEAYKREDLVIQRRGAATTLDRTLGTIDAAANRALWRAAGYAEPPTIREMVLEVARYDFRLGTPS